MSINTYIQLAQGLESLRPLAQEVATGREVADAVTIYRGSRNRLYYIPQGAGNPLSFPVNVKCFRVPPFPNNFIYRHIRPSKAQRSFDNAVALLSLGFSTPEPLGWIEERTPLLLLRSYYLCRHMEHPNMRLWWVEPFAHEMARALGREMARLHSAGIWFRDFSNGNILYSRTDDGSFRFWYVDLNRMEFGVRSSRKLMRMFSAISWDANWTAEVARHYAEASGLDPEHTAAMARKIHDRFNRQQRLKTELKVTLRK